MAVVSKKGFTLIELLMVIAIIAILSTAVVLILNPAELIRQSRDSTRLNDLQTINSALNHYSVQGGSSFGSLNTVYTSLPDTSATCATYTLPALPVGWSYSCKTSANYRNTNGTGWVPVNFTSISTGSPLPVLPVDPTNTAPSGLYYTYIVGSWELNAKLESGKFASESGSDGGDLFSHYEVGSNLLNSPRKNLFANGDFESSLDGMASYSNGTLSFSNSYGAKIGGYALYTKAYSVLGGGGTYGGTTKAMPAAQMTAGKIYTLSYWAKGVAGNGTITMSIQNGAGDNNCLMNTATLTTAWQKYTKTCTLDAVKSYMYIWGGAANFEWLMDGLQLVEGAE